MINIRNVSKDELNSIVGIHLQKINRGILYSLGKKFLYLIYLHICNSENSIIYVAEDNKKVVGFVSGTIDKQKLYRGFYRKYFPKILGILTSRIVVRPSLIIKIAKVLFSKSACQSELLSIAVIRQREGIGNSLINKLVEWYRKNKVSQFCVEIDKESTGNVFYKKYGFKKHGTTKIGKIVYNQYIYKIN